MDPSVWNKNNIRRLDSYIHETGPIIGEGTYGLVTKGRDKTSARYVAIKEFKPISRSHGISTSAVRELALLKELNHPNIIKLVDSFLHLASAGADGRQRQQQQLDRQRASGSGPIPFVPDSTLTLKLVFEFCEYDFYEIIKFHKRRNRPLSELQVQSLMVQLVTGLKHLHDRGIIHRDLKPANILVAGVGPQMGTVKIADFGLAREAVHPLRPLADNGVVVTRWYRPPELLFGAAHYTVAIDMWAVGCILGELKLLNALFPGEEKKDATQFESDQVEKIFRVLGTMTTQHWPLVDQLRWYMEIRTWPWHEPGLSKKFADYNPELPFYRLLVSLLDYHPDKRCTAAEALAHPFLMSQSREAATAKALGPLTGGRPVYPPRKARQMSAQAAAAQQHNIATAVPVALASIVTGKPVVPSSSESTASAAMAAAAAAAAVAAATAPSSTTGPVPASTHATNKRRRRW